MPRSTCSPTQPKPARILCGPVRGGARFGTWPFTCCFSSTFISPRKANPDSIRHHPFGLTELEPEVVLPEPAYGKDELLGYLEHCRKKLDAVMAGMTKAWVANPCPFPYRDMSNGELLLYNMRHVQHHAAQLNMLLRQATDSAPDWVSKGGQNIKA
jgi:hypothetical protein